MNACLPQVEPDLIHFLQISYFCSHAKLMSTRCLSALFCFEGNGESELGASGAVGSAV